MMSRPHAEGDAPGGHPLAGLPEPGSWSLGIETVSYAAAAARLRTLSISEARSR